MGAVILSGLFFREVVVGGRPPPADTTINGRRAKLFGTCFLVGPFAEAATGFGVGQVTTVAGLAALRLQPREVVVFGLLSQAMVPWGALANGTIVGAQLAGVGSTELGVRSAVLTAPLLLGWLVLFWHFARDAGVSASYRELVGEVAWLGAAAALLVAANVEFGPEVAALAALGPLIAVRFVLDRPSAADWHGAVRVGLPYAVLIAGLAASRALAPLNRLLAGAVAVRPFARGAAWLPLLHPSTWLVVVGIATAVALGKPRLLGQSARRAWAQGYRPCATILFYLVMAQVLAESGVAAALAGGIRSALGNPAVLVTPVMAGLFGFFTSSSNATNGLLMPSQETLASEAHLSVGWVAAIQNTAAAALTMLSPVRVAMGCALVGRPELEGAVYRQAWLFGASAACILVAAAVLLLLA